MGLPRIHSEVNALCDSSHNLLEVWLGKARGEVITKRCIRQERIGRQSVNCCNSRRDERQSWRKFKLELKTEQGKKRWWTANIDWLYLVPHSTCTPCGWVPHFHKSLGLYLTREKGGKKLAAASSEHKAWTILHHAIVLLPMWLHDISVQGLRKDSFIKRLTTCSKSREGCSTGKS